MMFWCQGGVNLVEMVGAPSPLGAFCSMLYALSLLFSMYIPLVLWDFIINKEVRLLLKKTCFWMKLGGSVFICRLCFSWPAVHSSSGNTSSVVCIDPFTTYSLFVAFYVYRRYQLLSQSLQGNRLANTVTFTFFLL